MTTKKSKSVQPGASFEQKKRSKRKILERLLMEVARSDFLNYLLVNQVWILIFFQKLFLVVSTRLYKRVCPSVRRSVGRSIDRSVGPSVWNAFSRLAETKMAKDLCRVSGLVSPIFAFLNTSRFLGHCERKIAFSGCSLIWIIKVDYLLPIRRNLDNSSKQRTSVATSKRIIFTLFCLENYFFLIVKCF